MPTAMFSFLPRSAWPMKPAIGACTESDDVVLARELAEPRREVVVHPEAALEVDLAGGVAALEQRLDRRLRALPRGHPRGAEVQPSRHRR